MQVIVVEKFYDQQPGNDKVYSFFGLSSFPFPVEGSGLDVIYMNAGALSGSTKTFFINETGHWLSLLHTFALYNGCPAATS
jgi:hypothetical protein